MAKRYQPKGARMKVTSINVDLDQWQQVKAKAALENRTLTQVIMELCEKWLKGEVVLDDDKEK